MAAVNVTFPGNLAQVASGDELRRIPSALIPAGSLYIVLSLAASYAFDPGSTATDDGQNIIRPNDRNPLQAGRWVYQVDGIAPGAPGPTGPASNTYTSYAAMQASDPTRKSAQLVGDTDSPPHPDGPYYNPTQTIGGWVPQTADGIAYKRPVSGASTTKLPASVAALGVTAGDFSAAFDGSTNDTSAIQKMIDAGANAGVPVLLPGATAVLQSPLDFRGRYVSLTGIQNKTTFIAGSPMAVMLNIEESTEIASYSPLMIDGITLNGNNLVTNANLSLRFRREHVLRNIYSIFAPRGIRLRDANNGTLDRVRTNGCAVGLYSEGSNHATVHLGCSFLGADTTGVLVENFGTALDGNNALLFSNCVVQSGTGNCYDVGPGCAISIDTSYTGENQNGTCFTTRGDGVISVTKGIAYFGYSPTSYLTRPVGGMISMRDVDLFSQNVGRGIQFLSGLTPEEAATAGKMKFRDSRSQFTVGGGPTRYNGNMLATDPCTAVFAPRLGKSYTAEADNATFTTALAGPNNNGRTVTCTAVTGANPVIGLYASLINPAGWRDGEPLYLVVVYSATKPVSVRTNTGPLAAPVVNVGSLPTTPVITSYVNVEAIASADPQTTLEFAMSGVVAGDTFTLHHVGLSDATLVRGAVGVMPNLFLP